MKVEKEYSNASNTVITAIIIVLDLEKMLSVTVLTTILLSITNSIVSNLQIHHIQLRYSVWNGQQSILLQAQHFQPTELTHPVGEIHYPILGNVQQLQFGQFADTVGDVLQAVGLQHQCL